MNDFIAALNTADRVATMFRVGDIAAITAAETLRARGLRGIRFNGRRISAQLDGRQLELGAS